MAIKSIMTTEEVCTSFDNPNTQVIQTWYIPSGENMRIGLAIYIDYALTQKIPANRVLGAKLNGKNYNLQTDSNSLVASFSECQETVNAEILVVTPPLNLGEVRYSLNGSVEFIRSKLEITDNSTSFIVNDIAWNNHFEDTNNYTKVCFWATETESSVRTKTLQNVNLEDMRGFDMTAWIGYMKNNPIWEAGKFINQHIHIPVRAGQNRRRWIENDVEYFFMPNEYIFDSSHLPKFMTFHDFTLPQNITFFTQLRLKGVDQKSYLNKGFTHVADNTAPLNKVARYDYDAWAYAAGCPSHGGGRTIQDIENWLTNVDTNTLVSSFMNNFGNIYKNYAYAIMDYEAIGYANPGIGGKLQACFDAWKASNPSAKLAAWAHKFMWYGLVDIQGNYYPQAMTDDLKFSGSFDDFIAQRDPQSPVTIHHGIYRNMLDVFYIGGYHNAPTNYGFLEHGLLELMLMQKYAPNKETLFSYWYNIEYVSNSFPLGDTYFKKNDGTPLKCATKPVAFPHDMWNVGIWFLTNKNSGVDLWSDPFARSENPDYYGDGKKTRLVDGTQIPDSYENIGNGYAVYTYQNYKCVDWLVGAAKRVSENKDIIEDNTNWQFADYSLDNGSTWITGDERLPSKTIYSKNPLCMFKTNSAGTQALLRLVNQHGDATKKKTILVKVGSKIFSVNTFGRYSTFARLYNL